jgi:hypothetical protein
MIVIFRIFHVLPKFKIKNEALTRYYNLERTVEDLSKFNLDTSKYSEFNGVLKNWDETALLIEKIRVQAVSLGIEFTYSIDSLVATSATINNIYRMPIHITAFPTNGKFETVMQFFQNAVSDTSLNLSLESLSITGDDFGLASANITLYGWIQL